MVAGVDGAGIIEMGHRFVSWCDTLSASPKSNNSTLILGFEFPSFRLFPSACCPVCSMLLMKSSLPTFLQGNHPIVHSQSVKSES